MARNIATPMGEIRAESLLQNDVQSLAWTGVTINATPAEIFLEGSGAAPDGRLVLPSNRVVIGTVNFLAYNKTDNTVHCSGRQAISLSNLAGTVAASGVTTEWDVAATDANPNINYFVGSAAAGLVFTYNDTLKALVATVTGVTAKTIEWKAVMTGIVSL